jgi:hypothetical protein
MMKARKAAIIVVLIALFLISLQTNYGQDLILDDSAFSLDKTEYSLGESVQINIAEQYIDQSYLVVANEKSIYKYLNQLTNPVTFNIKEELPHTVKLLARGDNQLVSLKTFEVGEMAEEPNVHEEPQQPEIQNASPQDFVSLELEKEHYDLNEPVNISILGFDSFEKSDLKLFINTGNQSYRYLGLSPEILFIPNQEGEYLIILLDQNNMVLAQESFDVISGQTGPPPASTTPITWEATTPHLALQERTLTQMNAHGEPTVMLMELHRQARSTK